MFMLGALSNQEAPMPPGVLTKLGGWWDLEELGTDRRFDSHTGNHDWSVISGLSNTTGLIGNATLFNATSDYGRTSAGWPTGNVDFAMAMFVHFNATSANDFIVWRASSSVSGASVAGDWTFGRWGNSQFIFNVSDNGTYNSWGGTNVTTSGDPVQISAGNTYWAYFHYIASTREMAVSINNGTLYTATAANNMFTNGNTLRFGHMTSSYPHNFDGWLDSVQYFTSPLTADERTWLYNDGLGRNYAATQTAITLPTQISDLELWLDASDRGVTTNQWDDKSGQGNHFTSPTAGNFPSFAGGIATFNGSSTYLTGPSGMMTGAGAGEIFLLQKRYADNSETGANTGWLSFGTHTDAFQDHFTYNATIYSGFGSTVRKTIGDPPANIAAWHVANMYSAPSDFYAAIDNDQIYGTSSNTVAWDAVSTIGASWSAGIFFQGDIKCVLVFRRKLTGFERQQVLAYLGTL